MKGLASKFFLGKRFLRSISLLLLFLFSLVLTLSLKLLPVTATLPIRSTKSAQEQGELLFKQENYANAIPIWQQVEAEYRQNGDVLNQAMALSNLALTYQELGELAKSEEAIAKSLSLLGYNPQVTEPQQVSNDHKGVLAQSLDIRGHHYFLTGKMEEALQTWRTSGNFYEQIQDEPRRIQNLINQSQVLQSLGKFLEAKRILQTIEASLKSATIELRVKAFRSLGNVLRQIGELSESEDYLQNKILNLLAEKLNPETVSAVYLDLGDTEVALGEKKEIIGKKEEAKGYFEKALNSYQKSAQLDKYKLQSQLNQIALILEHKAFLDLRTTSLEELVTNTQNLIEKLPPSRSAILSRIRMAKLTMKKGENKEAIAQLLNIAIQQSKYLGDKRSHSYSLGTYGTLLEQNKDLDEALQRTNLALSISQSINAPDISYRWQWQAGRLLKEKGEIKEAIASYDTAIKTLTAVRYNLLPINPDVQFSFRDNVEPVYREYIELLLSNPNPTQDNLKQAIKQVDALQLAEIEDYLRCNLSNLVSLDESKFLESKTAIIYPIILSNQFAVIVQSPDTSLTYYSYSIKKEDVEEKLKKLKSYLIQPSESSKAYIILKEVYKWVNLQSIFEQQNTVENLVFVLDGLLRNIPMVALVNEEGRYLIETDYNIAIAPRLKTFEPKPTPKKLNVLIGGSSQTISKEGIKLSIANLSEELEAVGNLVDSKIFLREEEFTPANIEKQLETKDFSAIHFKSHGFFSSDPEETYITTSGEIIDIGELANLIRVGSQNQENPIELLVLGACETATGDNRAILGLAGIAVLTGARSTLSTLWKASDQRNTDLMRLFYSYLKKEETKSKALHLAQRELREQRVNLKDWSTYVLVGDWL